MPKKEKTLKELKQDYDQKVLNYISSYSPHTSAGEIERKVVIPEKIIKDRRQKTGDTGAVCSMRTLDQSLQRLKRQGKIWFNTIHRHWEVVE